MSPASLLHAYLWEGDDFLTQCLLQSNSVLAFSSLYTIPTNEGWSVKERTWKDGKVLSCQNIAVFSTQLKAFDLFRSEMVSFREKAQLEADRLGARFTSSPRSPFSWKLLPQGALVSTLHPIEAYNSGNGEMPYCFFEPGDSGNVVETDLPSVWTSRENPRGVFASVDFEKPGVISKRGPELCTWRCQLYYHHAVRLSSCPTDA